MWFVGFFLQVSTKYLNVCEPISQKQSLPVAIVILGSKKKHTLKNGMFYGFCLFVVFFFFRYSSRCLKTENWKKYIFDTLLLRDLSEDLPNSNKNLSD